MTLGEMALGEMTFSRMNLVESFRLKKLGEMTKVNDSEIRGTKNQTIFTYLVKLHT